MTGVIERVVVPLDATSESLTAIDTASRLAARTRAPLHGVFVEDEDLLRLAGLPFARQVTVGAGTMPFAPEEAELYLRAAAERTRKELLAAAQRQHVVCSFEVVRGGSEAAVSGASERELIVAGALARPVVGNFRLECRWWSSLEIASGPVLLARHKWSSGGATVMLLRDFGPASGRLLAAAAELAEAKDGLLTLVAPPAAVAAHELDAWLADRLKTHTVRLQVETAPADPADLQRRIGQLDCGLLALEAGLVEGRGSRLRELVQEFACDLLVVR